MHGARRMYRACRIHGARRMALRLSDLRFIAIDLFSVGRKRRSRLPTLSKPITAVGGFQRGHPDGVLVRAWGCVEAVDRWGASDASGMSDGALLIQPTFHREKFISRRSEKAQPPSDIIQTNHRRWWFTRRSPRRCFGSGVSIGVVWKRLIGGACRMYRACRMALCLSDLRFIAVNLYSVGRKRRSRLPTLSKPITAADFLQGGYPRWCFGSGVGLCGSGG